MAAPFLTFQIRREGYACLTIEALEQIGAGTGGGAKTLPEPPLPEPMLDQNQSAPLGNLPLDTAAVQTARGSRPWLSWFWELRRAVVTGGSTGADMTLVAPSVDETDSEWYGLGKINATDDPATFTATLSGGSRFGNIVTITAPGAGYSFANFTIIGRGGTGFPEKGTGAISGGKITGYIRTTAGYDLQAPLSVAIAGDGAGATATAMLGRQWATGDYLIWNDPSIIAMENSRSYEICQLQKIIPVDATHFTATVSRGEYGSAQGAHTSLAFYRLINEAFHVKLDPNNGPQPKILPWPNMMVAAAQFVIPQQLAQLVNLAAPPYLGDGTTLDVRNSPPCPGLRTMNGAAYINLGSVGAATLGGTSQARWSPQAWESIRCLYAKVLVAPVGASLILYVFFIDAVGNVGLLDVLTIPAGSFASYSAANVPDGRQMPYHASIWSLASPNFDWPPHRLPKNTTGLDANGNLKLAPGNAPPVIDPTQTVLFSPDGHPQGAVDYIVTQVGSVTPGGNPLVISTQT